MTVSKKNEKASKGKSSGLSGWVWGLALFLVMVFSAVFFFINQVMPGKVAESLVRASQNQRIPQVDPSQYGLKYENVEFKTSDGISLKGWWIPSSLHNPKGTVILTHGAFHNREQVLTRAVFLQEAGYQVLTFDLRGHGESAPAPLTGGFLEAGDFTAAERFLSDKHWIKKPLTFYGFSLGAICALRSGAVEPVDAIIADSPLPNVKSYVSRKTIGAPFASLPGFLAQCLRAYDLATGLHLTETDLDLVPVMRQIKTVPVLIFSGEKDDLARSSEVQGLFDQCPAPHRRLVYIPDAGHEQTYSQYPVIYEKAVLDFLRDVKDGFPEDKNTPGIFSKPLPKPNATPIKK
jgi:uncharacterized protein